MSDISVFAQTYVDGLEKAMRNIDLKTVEAISDALWAAYEQDHTVYVFGNGGSAATASHLATDLGKGTLGHRGDLPVRGFRAISLSDNLALITAWANDAGYDSIFAGQLARLVAPGDAVIAISASGNSPNVLAAVELASRSGATTIGLAGFGGGQLAAKCNYALTVDSYDYGIVEDAHMCLVHILTQYLRQCLFATVGKTAETAPRER